MGYLKAEEILPMEIIELIQQYFDGESIYSRANHHIDRHGEQAQKLSRNL